MSKHRKAPAEQKVVNEEKRTMVNEVRELRKNNERLMVPDTRKYWEREEFIDEDASCSIDLRVSFELAGVNLLAIWRLINTMQKNKN